MTQLTVADVEQMQQGSSKLAELFGERSELISEFSTQLAEIDERINEEMGGGFAPGHHAPSVATPRSNGTGTARTTRSRANRTPRASNPHSLPWYLLVVMDQGGGEEVTEATMVERVLDMGYNTNASDFHNSVYTTLYTMQREDKLVKKGEAERAWKLTAKGAKIATKNAAEWDEEKDE